MKPMRAAVIGVGVVASVALHVGVFAGVSRIQPKRVHAATVVAVVNQKRKPKPRSREEEEKKPDEPPKPPPQAKTTVPKQAPPKAAPPSPPPADAPPPVAAAPANAAPATGNYANLSGLSFGNGPGGIAVAPPAPVGGGGAAPTSSSPAPTRPVERSFGSNGSNGSKPAGAATGGDDGCTEAEVKAKASTQLNAPYSDDARSAGVGGKVHVKVTIDETGAVVDAKVTKGLGHGLDENAIATAKRWRFSPATRCGKAVASSKVISFVFELAE